MSTEQDDFYGFFTYETFDYGEWHRHGVARKNVSQSQFELFLSLEFGCKHDEIRIISTEHISKSLFDTLMGRFDLLLEVDRLQSKLLDQEIAHKIWESDKWHGGE